MPIDVPQWTWEGVQNGEYSEDVLKLIRGAVHFNPTGFFGPAADGVLMPIHVINTRMRALWPGSDCPVQQYGRECSCGCEWLAESSDGWIIDGQGYRFGYRKHNEPPRQRGSTNADIPVNRGRDVHIVWKGNPEKGFPITRYVGLELEVLLTEDGTALPRALEATKAYLVADSSIHPTDRDRHRLPREINTHPTRGSLFEFDLAHITNALATDARVNESCGLHVHIDARDAKYWDIHKIYSLYIKFEDHLFSLVHPSRRSLHFCEPMKNKPKDKWDVYRPGSFPYQAAKRRFHQALYGVKTERAAAGYKRDKYNSNRYSALNLHSWAYRGTIEFRHHHGSTNYEEILAWTVLCHSIVDVGIRKSYKQIEAIPANLEGLLTIIPKAFRDYTMRKFAQSMTNSGGA